MTFTWTPGDVSGGTTLTDNDHLYNTHVNELRAAADGLLGTALTNGTTVSTLSGTVSNMAGTVNYLGTAGIGNYINVRSYGAIGNGTADDGTAILAAIAAVPSSGGNLYFPAGTYYMGTTYVNSGKQMNVFGDGMGASTLLFGTAVNTTFWCLSGQYSSVQDLTISGNWPNNNVHDFALLELAADDMLVNRVEVKAMRALGIQVDRDHCKILNSRFIGPNTGTVATMPVWFNFDGTAIIKDFEVHGNTFLNSGLGGLFGGANGLKITNNYFKNNHLQTTPTGGGQMAIGGTGVLISGNIIESGGGVATSGMEMNASNCVIAHNYIKNQGLYGIILQMGSNYDVIGNNISAGTLDGLSIIGGMQRVNITGNTIYNNTRYGIEVVTGTTNYYMITHNIITANGTAQVQDNGTGTSKLVTSNILS